jgi:hypothetical protein
MTEPGWYQDPLNADKIRWWDGKSWTEHEQPVTPTLDPSYPEPENATDYFTNNPLSAQGENNDFIPFSRNKAQPIQVDLPAKKPPRNRTRITVFLVIAFLLVGGVLQSMDSRTTTTPQSENIFPSVPAIPSGAGDDTVAGALDNGKTEPSADNPTTLDPVTTPTKNPQPSPTQTETSIDPSSGAAKPTVKDSTQGSSAPSVIKLQPPRGLVSVFSSGSGLVVSWKKSASNPKSSKYEVIVRYGSEKIIKMTTSTDIYFPQIASGNSCSIEIRTVSGSKRSLPARSRCGA